MAILDDVKGSLGISNTSKDADITRTIDSAKQAMKMQGVQIIDETDPHTEQCIILYCRAWYNFQGDGERYSAQFERMANALALELDYMEES